MKKYVKRCFKLKEKYLMLLPKEHQKFRISKHLLQLILLHNKQNRKNQRSKPKFPNGSYKVKLLELDLSKVGDSNYQRRKKLHQILPVGWLSALFAVGNSTLTQQRGTFRFAKQNQNKCLKMLEVTLAKNDFYLSCTETRWIKRSEYMRSMSICHVIAGFFLLLIDEAHQFGMCIGHLITILELWRKFYSVHSFYFFGIAIFYLLGTSFPFGYRLDRVYELEFANLVVVMLDFNRLILLQYL